MFVEKLWKRQELKNTIKQHVQGEAGWSLINAVNCVHDWNFSNNIEWRVAVNNLLFVCAVVAKYYKLPILVIAIALKHITFSTIAWCDKLIFWKALVCRAITKSTSRLYLNPWRLCLSMLSFYNLLWGKT